MASKCLFRSALKRQIYFKNSRSLSASNETSNSDKNDNETNGDEKKTNWIPFLIAGGGGLAGFAAYQFYKRNNRKTYLATQPALKIDENEVGAYIEGLPTYTLDEVSKHASPENKIWVTYKQGVYDVTDFVQEHPGGDNILLAAGSSVEPFWLLYAVHKNPQVYKIMQRLRIGNLAAEDAQDAVKDLLDPYSGEPQRHRVLKPASVKPFNAEPPSSLIVDSFLTPKEIFYVRNHLPVPEVDPKTYELEIECEGKDGAVSLTLDDIKKFPKHTVTSTIMCAGNRRSEMTKVKTVKGLDWQNAAIGNATWTGARLCDVLKAAGIKDDDVYQHIQFEGLDMDPTSKPYGASIPAWKAFDRRSEVLLAYEMNGEPLMRDHGYPIRVIVPGVVGARNVKWLGRIVLANDESESHWQRNDYKGFSPSTDWDTVDFTKSPAIQELPVISSICRPMAGEKVKIVNGNITVQGYAWSGGGNKIVRVDVTLDGGESWHVANLDFQDNTEAPHHWAWTLWTVKLPVPSGTSSAEIWVKAVDSNYNTQPESFKNIWNLRGVLNNAYHRVKVQLSS